jgi:hypothetical protein
MEHKLVLNGNNITFWNLQTNGLKEFKSLPVLGWMQKGDLSKWFNPLVTLISRRG